MSISIARRVSRIAAWTLFAFCVPILAHAAKFVSFWQLSENQPNIPNGGRANTIAIHPVLHEQMFVASESGGLFKSFDSGVHWTHVDSLPVYFTQAVAYVPSSPNVVLVTAKTDFKSTNGGGLWRSTDSGATWTQMALTPPGFTGRLSAFEISIRPSDEAVFVATSRGVFSSTDAGSTWTYSDVFVSGNHTVLSVLATSRLVLAGGPSGVARFDASSATPRWLAVSATVGGIQDIHGLGRSALSSSHAFLVNANSELFRSEDLGVTWTQISSAPLRGMQACGGISFIRTTQQTIVTARLLHLYYGNRCGLHHLIAPVNGAGVANFGGTWQQPWLGHGDTRDLAILDNRPVFLATDGGLHNTPDGGANWPFVGGSRDGYSALQVTEVKGQAVGIPPTTDIYFGTQDNDVWSTNIFALPFASTCCEGFFIEAERKVAMAADANVAYRTCGDCFNKISDRHLANEMLWPNAPGSGAETPSVIRNSTYVQATRGSGDISPGLALTEDSGAHWRQFAAFDLETRDSPKVGRSGEGDPLLTSIVYEVFRSAVNAPGFSEVNHLMRIHKRLFSNAAGTVFFPAMNGFGGLGINPTEFAWYQVLGIDPGNAFHIIAPDVVNQKMMETRDGGENWTEIPGLTNLVTDNGRFLFRANFLNDGRGPIFPVVTAVSFSPQDPRLVLIGTSEGGIFVSHDNGATWGKLTGSDRATYITSFFWENANTVHVSTYGRGLWKLRNRKIAIPSAFDDLCGPSCQVVSNDSGPDRPPFAGGVLVYEGTVLGAKTNGSQLKELFVTPGSSVMFIGDEKDPQWDIAITETDRVDPKELTPLPEPPKGWITKGVVFADGDKLTGTVFGESEMTLVPPVSPEMFEGSTVSPAKGKPYITLIAPEYTGVPAAEPLETFEVDATGFIADQSYVITIDGETTKLVVTADRAGAFTAKLSAPDSIGYHVVEVRPAKDTETVIDSSTFYVKHSDSESE